MPWTSIGLLIDFSIVVYDENLVATIVGLWIQKQFLVGACRKLL